jgi:hypothetical protein
MHRDMNRALALLLLVMLSMLAMGMVMAPSPGDSLATRIARYPYLPEPIIPGMSVREFTNAVAKQQLTLNPDTVIHGVPRPGVVQAWSSDHRVNVFIWLEPDGAIRHVRFKLTASDADNAQLMSQSAQSYAAAQWSRDSRAAAQLTFTSDSRTMCLFSLFECDPDKPDEPNFVNLDLRDSQLPHPGWPWSWFRS